MQFCYQARKAGCIISFNEAAGIGSLYIRFSPSYSFFLSFPREAGDRFANRREQDETRVILTRSLK